MIWGSQYDAMLNWIIATEEDKAKVMLSTNGNHQGNSTGAVECGSYGNGSDKINNIYDLEGNLREWTMEASTYGRVTRGGYYGNRSYTPSRRDGYYNNNINSDIGSRITLYIKN